MKIWLHLLLLFAVRLLAVNGYLPRLFTCDVDLVSEKGDQYYRPWRPDFLSQECKGVYNKRSTDNAMYRLYEEEALAFKEFIGAIETFEAKKSRKELCAKNDYPLHINYRQNFYKEVDLCSCYKKNNYETFLKCLIEKRKELTKIIRKKT
ncbi:uncharacterized protein LOC105218597 [Zeugodacus cucurbitae]|uniref:uncharacterized protein LOC105218597 n=1 Tax=Zeugodacus cucurbitae TaxID=28588 RepID=UPI0005968E02|nr:uncharacterized protein LOC105218597 [Zeugodacus cucurbitae]